MVPSVAFMLTPSSAAVIVSAGPCMFPSGSGVGPSTLWLYLGNIQTHSMPAIMSFLLSNGHLQENQAPPALLSELLADMGTPAHTGLVRGVNMGTGVFLDCHLWPFSC
jgi:hypothetical protein